MEDRMTDKTLKVPTAVLKRKDELLRNVLSKALFSQEVLLNKDFDDEMLSMTAEQLEFRKTMLKRQRELLESLSGKTLGLESLLEEK